MSNAMTKVRLCSATRELALAWKMKAEYVAAFPEDLAESAEVLRLVADELEGSTRQLSRTREALYEATYLAEAGIVERSLDDLTTKRAAPVVDALRDLVELRETFRQILGDREEVVSSPVLRGTALDPASRDRSDKTPTSVESETGQEPERLHEGHVQSTFG